MHFELAMNGGALLFRPVANDASKILTLTLGDDLLEFRPRM